MKRMQQLVGILLSVLFISLLGAGASYSKILKVGVLPFEVHGPTQYRYLAPGVQSMLGSRLGATKEMQEINISGYTPPFNKKMAKRIMAEKHLDFILWGNITVIPPNVSIDVNIIGKKRGFFVENLTTSENTLIQNFNGFVDRVKITMLGGKKPIAQSLSAPVPSSPKTPPLSYLNPSFQYETSATTRRGFIRTQSLPYKMVGMDVGDANGDGKNEVFIIGEHRVYAYIMLENRLKPLGVFDGGSNKRFLNINLLDRDRDGCAEIYISAMDSENTVSSFVLSFKKNRFKVLAKNIDIFFNVKRLPPDFSKRLIGQKKGVGNLFSPGVHEVVEMRGKYTLGPTIDLPQGANLFNFTYLPEGNSYKIIVDDIYDHLRVYSADNNFLSKTQTTYAASSIGIECSNALPGLANYTQDPKNMFYIPCRIIPCDLDHNGKFELIVAHNISISAMFFERFRDFPEGQIHCLYWDGVGLSLQWKTRTIHGSIRDYGLKDINNDGKKELYVGITTYPGALGFKNIRSIVLVYPLKSKDKEQGL